MEGQRAIDAAEETRTASRCRNTSSSNDDNLSMLTDCLSQQVNLLLLFGI